MTLESTPFLLTAITYLALGCWIIFRHQNKTQQLYGVLCIATCFWQGVWMVLFSKMPPSSLNLYLKIGYSGIVFVPSIFYHFISEFSPKKERAVWINVVYASSLCFLVLIWSTTAFISGFHCYEWGVAAKASFMHPFFVALVICVLVRMLIMLVQSIRSADSKLKSKQTKLVFLALIIYSGGALDVVSNYGYPMRPFSSVFTGVALALFSYAIFRFELLSISAQAENEFDRKKRLAVSSEMKNLDIATAFPLVSQGEVLGYLLLGEKMSEEMYTREDLLLLRIVANQAALAYQRVRYLEMAVRGARTEMLGEIAGGFAHEIKTPLANISLPAELCFIDLTDVEQGKRKIEEVLPELKQRMKDIMQQTFKASDKIEAIRQFSKPGQIQLESVELLHVMHGSFAVLDHVLHKAGVNLTTDFPGNIPRVRGNAKQLEIVFVNLIKNGTEAMVSGNPAGLARNLALKIVEEGNYVAISIKDSGPGIKRTDVGHLFEAYFTTKGSSGTGMGLFLSHQVIKAQGGSIEVKSEEGKGTEFIVRLPKYSSESHSGVHEAA